MATLNVFDNSAQLDYSAGVSKGEILSKAISFYTSHGWTLHDDSAGTNAKVVKAPNVDGVTEKFAHIDTSDGIHLYITVYENWDATNHAGTNPTTSTVWLDVNQDARQPRIDYANGGFVVLFATQRYLAAYATNSTYGPELAGCFERTRIQSGDAPGVGPDLPPFLWTCGHGINAPCMSFPRVGRQGEFTDADNAWKRSAYTLFNIMVVETVDKGMAPQTMPNAGVSDTYNVKTLFEDQWGVSEIYVHEFWGDFVGISEALGVLYGLKIVPSKLTTISAIGNDFISPKVDSSLRLANGGVQHKHWMLPVHRAQKTGAPFLTLAMPR